jgi:hypothetical protein
LAPPIDGTPDVVHNHGGAITGERQSMRTPQACAGASDERNPVLKQLPHLEIGHPYSFDGKKPNPWA